MYNHTLYLLYWLIASVILFAINLFIPGEVVLGNFQFNAIEAAIYAGFWITVIFWAIWDYLKAKNVNLKKDTAGFLVFFAINFVAVWLVSRFSHIAGFGIVSFWWGVIIALGITALQGFVHVGEGAEN